METKNKEHPKPKAIRVERLSSAMRQNLLRRKQQQRSRQENEKQCDAVKECPISTQ